MHVGFAAVVNELSTVAVVKLQPWPTFVGIAALFINIGRKRTVSSILLTSLLKFDCHSPHKTKPLVAYCSVTCSVLKLLSVLLCCSDLWNFLYLGVHEFNLRLFFQRVFCVLKETFGPLTSAKYLKHQNPVANLLNFILYFHIALYCCQNSKKAFKFLGSWSFEVELCPYFIMVKCLKTDMNKKEMFWFRSRGFSKLSLIVFYCYHS